MNNAYKNMDIGTSLAKEAKIEAIYGQGKTTGYFIILKGNGDSIVNKITHSEFYSAFVSAIELRIKNKDYINNCPFSYLDEITDYSFEEDAVLEVVRAVSTSKYKMLILVGNQNKP
jgi:hypothetical protein